jgi:site-specific DNA-methyltransferase (adenine-specific)
VTRDIRNTPKASKQDWATPDYLYLALDDEFRFTIDLAAAPYNAKHSVFVSEEHDLFRYGNAALAGHRGFLNPPYARISEFLGFCYAEKAHGLLSVCVLPASVNSSWFHAYAKLGIVDFFKGRVSYEDATPADVEVRRLLPALLDNPSKYAGKVAPLLAELIDERGVYVGPEPSYLAFCHAYKAVMSVGANVDKRRADIKSSGASFDSMVVIFDPRLPDGPYPFRSRSGATGRLL